MNVNLIRLKPVVKELRAIGSQLSRLADCWETELSQLGINMRPPKADTSGAPPTVDYVDEEMDWAHETIDRLKREDELKDKEDE